MRVLVCGGREYKNRSRVGEVLDELRKAYGKLHIIEGGARGADRLAFDWAIARGMEHTTRKAKWNEFGKTAGAIRNQEMIDLDKPRVVVAFPGGNGTADMVRRAHAEGLPVWEVDK